MTGDLGKAFEKMKTLISFNHGGILVQREGNKFKWAGRLFDTLEELDRYREEPNLNIRVVRPNNEIQND